MCARTVLEKQNNDKQKTKAKNKIKEKTTTLSQNKIKEIKNFYWQEAKKIMDRGLVQFPKPLPGVEGEDKGANIPKQIVMFLYLFFRSCGFRMCVCVCDEIVFWGLEFEICVDNLHLKYLRVLKSYLQICNFKILYQ